MKLKSAFEDLSQTTLGAISGCLRRLEYLAGLRQLRGEYWHWGFSKLHGEPAAKKAFYEAHRAAVSEVLCTPLRTLLNDVESSSRGLGVDAEKFLEGLKEKKAGLLPSDPGAGSARHLSSVLHALLGLERNRRPDAIPRASSPHPPLVQSPRHPGDTAGSGVQPETEGEAEE
ncbi:MAG: hypothetical protein JWN74_3185 [Acidobacteriaceae bacterium]|nr:hypothetical protein [Acidobacteriaceae bacterium]